MRVVGAFDDIASDVVTADPVPSRSASRALAGGASRRDRRSPNGDMVWRCDLGSAVLSCAPGVFRKWIRYRDSSRQAKSGPLGLRGLCHDAGCGVVVASVSVSHQVWSGFQPASTVAESPSPRGSARVAVVR